MLKKFALLFPLINTCFSQSSSNQWLENEVHQHFGDRKTHTSVSDHFKHPILHWINPQTNIEKYQLHSGNVPVFGETKLLVLDKSNKVKSLATNHLNHREINLIEKLSTQDSSAKITLMHARKIATKDLRSNSLVKQLPASNNTTKEGLYWYRFLGNYKLVWYFRLPAIVDGFETWVEYFIDAKSGVIFNKIDNLIALKGKGYSLSQDHLHTFEVVKESGTHKLIDKQRQLEIFNSNLETHSSDIDNLWDKEGQSRKDNQKAEVELYLNMQKVIDTFKNKYNFIWHTGQKPVKAIAHVMNNFNNAYFLPEKQAFYFGDGSGKGAGFDYLTKALDVAAHEYGHGIMHQLSPLTYSDESGTLNEHIADVMGVIVDPDWLIGEDIALGDYKAGRNLQDPTWGRGDLLEYAMEFQEWEIMNRKSGLKFIVYPDRMGRKIYCKSWFQDNGGVHVNAPIFNKFFYLASTADGLGSTPVTKEKMGDLYMSLLKGKWLDKNSTFQAFKSRLITCANDFFRKDANKEEYINTIQNAFKKIGMR
ncbi:MAG: M4 family metallopeptidase [Candidatus Cloacimonetes bacterium]|nr:M4 family metallopeptidase [Candidatus Cloacimonadota bacterium]